MNMIREKLPEAAAGLAVGAQRGSEHFLLFLLWPLWGDSFNEK